jgi:SNF2 family DNA or RNA helicase
MRYRPKTKPFAHQRDALRWLWTHEFDDGAGGGALLMAPRTGKTKTVIDYASALFQAGKIDCVTVFAPLTVLSVWQDEIARHSPISCDVLLWDKRGRRRRPLPRLSSGQLAWVLINYDALSSSKRRKSGRPDRRSGRYMVKAGLVAWLGKSAGSLCVLDESHRAKNPSAKVSRLLHSIGGCYDYRVIATGTVVTKRKRTIDTYSQWKFLNPSSPLVLGHTAESFRDTYGLWTSRNGYRQFLAPKNTAQLREFVHRDAFSITREECFDLPTRLPDQIVHVDLEASAPYYDKMAEEMIAEIETGEVTLAKIKLTQAIRLRQITGGVVKTEPTEERPDGRLIRIGDEKLVALKSLLSDLFEADEKVVVPAAFRADISSIMRMGRTLRVRTQVMVGGQSAKERSSAWRTFQRQSGPALIVCQPRTASLGIDLATAHTMIWYSLTTSWVDYSQMEDRIALSNIGCSFMYLLARGTVDEELYQAAQEDTDFAKLVHQKPQLLRRKT